MKVEDAVKIYTSYLKDNTRPNTIRAFEFTLCKFQTSFFGIELDSISDINVIDFLNEQNKNCSASTKCGRLGILRTFFNFIIDVTDADFLNPCHRPMIKRLFKSKRFTSPTLLEKDLVDELIFRTTNVRDRLILELMARAGMRIGEVLNMCVSHVDFDQATILLIEPKSQRQGEKVYITKKLCRKLQVFTSKIPSNCKVFNISYSTIHRMVRKSGRLVDSKLRPHDLRRHAATYASRNNIPIEIVSKVILRHANISTTQRYLGTIDPNEARNWIEHLHR